MTFKEDTLKYWHFSGFEEIYLEDSFVIEITHYLSSKDIENMIRFHMLLVLKEGHPLYHPPKIDEQYCYMLGCITFSKISNLLEFKRNIVVSIDANFEHDLDNIDSFIKSKDTYYLEGSWGVLELISSPPSLDLYPEEETINCLKHLAKQEFLKENA